MILGWGSIRFKSCWVRIKGSILVGCGYKIVQIKDFSRNCVVLMDRLWWRHGVLLDNVWKILVYMLVH